jgi:prolipoprotein diacylglyceryltransferase
VVSDAVVSIAAMNYWQYLTTGVKSDDVLYRKSLYNTTLIDGALGVVLAAVMYLLTDGNLIAAGAGYLIGFFALNYAFFRRYRAKRRERDARGEKDEFSLL